MKRLPGYEVFAAGDGSVRWDGVIRRGFDEAAAVCSLLDSPAATLFKDRPKVKAGLAGGYFVKRYNLPGSWNQFRRNFRKGRPYIATEAAVKLLESGIGTPEVMAALTEITGWQRRDFLITRPVPPDFVQLNSQLEPGPAGVEWWARFLEKLLNHFVRIQECGVEHGDLSFRNIFVDAGWERVMLIDLDGCCCSGDALSRSAREREIARLTSSFFTYNRQLPLAELAASICRKYCEVSGFQLREKQVLRRMKYLLRLP